MPPTILCRYCNKWFNPNKVGQVSCRGCGYLEFLTESLVPRSQYYDKYRQDKRY